MNNTILIADDSRTIREMYRQKLTHEGFRVTLAEGGREAVKLLSTETPDLIMLDLHMPDVDGYALLEVIRRHPRLKRVPVLILTGASDRVQYQRAFDMGATDFILKSTTPPDNVVRQIRSALHGRLAA
jgi:PleD family two-component response regulator